MTEEKLNALQRCYQQREALVDFVNDVSKIVSEPYIDVLGIEADGNVITNNGDDNINDIKETLDKVLDELKNFKKRSQWITTVA